MMILFLSISAYCNPESAVSGKTKGAGIASLFYPILGSWRTYFKDKTMPLHQAAILMRQWRRALTTDVGAIVNYLLKSKTAKFKNQDNQKLHLVCQ
ncbi:MAG: hypothetical protein LIP09_02245 [Bacteroidales bacterium]|nr:hypothetical protein [Bacteroidales bacterium]